MGLEMAFIKVAFKVLWDEGSSRRWIAVLAEAVGGEAWGRCAAGVGRGSRVTECLTPSCLLCNLWFAVSCFEEQYRRPAPSTSFSPASLTVGILPIQVLQLGNTEGLEVPPVPSDRQGQQLCMRSGRVCSSAPAPGLLLSSDGGCLEFGK